jgi:hypothetical protein
MSKQNAIREFGDKKDRFGEESFRLYYFFLFTQEYNSQTSRSFERGQLRKTSTWSKSQHSSRPKNYSQDHAVIILMYFKEISLDCCQHFKHTPLHSIWGNCSLMFLIANRWVARLVCPGRAHWACFRKVRNSQQTHETLDGLRRKFGYI